MESFCPEPPDWRVDWTAIDEALPEIRALRGCPQNPRHHAEGDVWIHTRMVCEALAALPRFRALPEEDREIVFSAAVLHDVGKPACTRQQQDGRITSRGHAGRGAKMARALLWQAGTPFDVRERAREHLRRGAPFAWNATNLSRRIRDACVGLFADYDARIRIVYVEASPERLQSQNRDRSDPVPDRVLDRLLGRWEVPAPFEGHQVEYWIDGRLMEP